MFIRKPVRTDPSNILLGNLSAILYYILKNSN